MSILGLTKTQLHYAHLLRVGLSDQFMKATSLIPLEFYTQIDDSILMVGKDPYNLLNSHIARCFVNGWRITLYEGYGVVIFNFKSINWPAYESRMDEGVLKYLHYNYRGLPTKEDIESLVDKLQELIAMIPVEFQHISRENDRIPPAMDFSDTGKGIVDFYKSLCIGDNKRRPLTDMNGDQI